MSHLFAHYPREVDMKARRVVHDMEGLQRYINNTNGKDNLTTTVYGFRQLKVKGNRCEYNSAIIPHVVVDLDKGRAKELLDMEDYEAGIRCTRDTLVLAQHLKDNNIRHAVWMTGGGFHVWVMLNKVYDVPSEEMGHLLFSGRAMINKWIRDMDLLTIDPVVSFRPDRHIRIPNTYNFKRGLWSIPVSIEELEKGWDSVTDRARQPSGGMKVCGEKGLEIEVVAHDPGNPYMTGLTGIFQKFDAAEISVEMKAVSGIPVLPCLEAAGCVKGSNPPHLTRAYLMMYLLDYFRHFARPPASSTVTDSEAVQKAHSFIRTLEWADYSPTITQQMLVHGASKRYQTPTCPTIFREGLCVGRCPFYDGKGVE